MNERAVCTVKAYGSYGYTDIRSYNTLIVHSTATSRSKAENENLRTPRNVTEMISQRQRRKLSAVRRSELQH